MIVLKANGRELLTKVNEPITTGSIGLPVLLTLSDDYDGLAVVVCFEAGEERADLAYLGNPMAVPPQCLTTAGYMLMAGVYALASDGTVAIPTVWAECGTIRNGTVPDFDPHEPAPSWPAQVQLAAQEAKETAERLATDVGEWADAEEARARAEIARAGAENARVTTETARATAEQARATAEQARVTAEQARGTAEDARVTEWASLKSEVNGAVDDAQGAAKSASAAAELATSAASSAAAAASGASAAASSATDAASSATSAAQAASAAASSAMSAAQSATSAASSATSAANAADLAATGANAAAIAASSAASDANDAADEAHQAASEIEGRISDVEEALDGKADTDGYYSLLTAGLAENLIGRGDAVPAEYLYRTAGGDDDISDGIATIDCIKGNTLVWNQLIKLVSSVSPTFGVTITTDPATGLVSFSGTTTGSGGRNNYIATNISLAAGHKYLLLDTIDYSSGNTVKWTLSDTTTTGYVAELTGGTIYTANSDRTCWIGKSFATEQVYDCSGYVSLYDLTLMFGAGNEPSTVAEFEAMFPEPYYPYSAPKLLSVDMRGVETVGFNQWDEEWELGGFSATGEEATSVKRIRSKNYIPIFGGMDYCISVDSKYNYSSWFAFQYYDADKNWISGISSGNGIARTAPDNARYLRFSTSDAWGGVSYSGGICINLSWSGYRNGEYEEYWSAERPIDTSRFFPTGLKKVSDKADALYADHYDTVIGSVDLGTAEWSQYNARNYPQVWTVVLDGRAEYETLNDTSLVNQTTWTTLRDNTDANTFYWYTTGTSSANGNKFLVSSGAYIGKTAEQMAELFAGHTVLYIKTPTTTPIEPPLNLSYKVSDFGTERIMVDETTDAPQTAPVPMDVEYGLNAIDTIRRLPTNYIPRDELESKLDEKADVDGYYSTMTVGAADNLTGRGDGASGQYLYRTAGGDEDIADGVANIRSIKGQTLVWNQLNNNSGISETKNGITVTKNSDGSWTVNGVSTSASTTLFGIFSLSRKSEHKYLVRGCASGGSANTYYLGFSGNVTDTGNGGIYTAGADTAVYLYLIIGAGATIDNLTFWPQCFDLTQMFGAGNEPSTVAEFEALFPKPYYPYSEPTLLSVNMEGIETVGFNQWDEEWEVGGYSGQDGNVWNTTDRIRSKADRYIRILPDTTYYSKCGSKTEYFFYDAAKSYISHITVASNSAFATPANAFYMRFFAYSGYGTTYNHDICINLSWSGYRNGEYEEYWKSQREIPLATYFPDGMRSAGTRYDELVQSLNFTKAITRIGAVDLGTLTWATGTDSTGQYFKASASIPNAKPSGDTTVIGNISCAKYTSTSMNNVFDGGIAMAANTGIPYVRDTTYSTAADFKAAMSGVMLYYALAEPTEVTIEPPLNLSYKVSDFGTEKIMVDEEADAPQSAPPIIQTAYGINATDTVRRLPTQYISHDSFQQFVTALQSAVGVTVTETWDENDGRYEYTVTQTGE